MKILNIDRLACGYKTGFALRDITISVPRGAFTGIIGTNGSGKSTLFKAIVGDLPLTDGNVSFDGDNLHAMSRKQRAKAIAVVPQFIEPNSITVEEYVAMGRLPYRKAFQFFDTPEDRDIVSEALLLTGIVHLKDKAMNELSGGEQQMVAIACALAQKTELLLLDEPTSHLDIMHQSRVMDLLQKLNEERKLTIMMIVHDLNLAAEYCTHIVLMSAGRIMKQGQPIEVITYDNIEKVYNTLVIVKENPISKKPVVFPISERRLNEYNKQQT